MMQKSGLVGTADIRATFQALGRVPQAAASKGARAGATIVRKAAKVNAPVDEGNLKRALILKREQSRKRGKAVYDVLIDPAQSAHFVKVSKEGKRSFYPASQEYGFMTVDGKYIPGYRYMRRSVDENAVTVERKILDVTAAEVDKALRKRGSRK